MTPRSAWRGVLLPVLIGALLACTAAPEARPSPQPSSPVPPTATPTASLAPSPISSPPASPTASPSPEPSSPAPTSPAPTTWSEPVRLEGEGHYDVALAVDEAGVAHVAAARQRAIHYLTNASGGWVDEQLTTPGGRGRRGQLDSQAALALDGGAAWIAFTRFGPEDVFGRFPERVILLSNVSGAWTTIQQLPEQQLLNRPSLVVDEGVLHLAYIEGIPFDVVEEGFTFPLRYQTVDGGAVSDVVVDQVADEPILRLDSSGNAWIAFMEPYSLTPQPGVKLARPDDGGFAVEHVTPTGDFDRLYGFVLDDTGRPHLLWAIDETPGLIHGVGDGSGGWTVEHVLDRGFFDAASLARDSAGTLHIVAAGLDDGIWYATNRGGTWVAEQIATAAAALVDIALDSAGRPHVIYVLEGDGSPWYTVGPGGG